MEIARRREQLGDDLFSDMMRTPMPDGRLLTDAELTNFAFLVLLGGMDTTSGTTGNSLLLIDRDPELRQQMIDNVDNMTKVIEEFLRIAGPGGGLYSRLTKDVDFHGEQMHEGDKVLMMYWAANRDPNAFPDPETIDIFRTNNRHMAFGLGPHRCLGSHHARLMLATLFRGVFTRIPDFQVQWDGVERFEDCGSVYAVRHLPVTFTPGTTVQTIAVTVNGDLLNEEDETFVVNLSSPLNSTLATSQGVGTILNDDPLPSLSIADTNVLEGDSGATEMQITVSLSAPTSGWSSK
jgi:cytochrome P450